MSKKRATPIFDLSLRVGPPALPKEWGPRNTRKDAKGDERCGLGGSCHIARPDIGRGSDALLRGMSKKRATAIFDQRQYLTCPSELVPLPPSWSPISLCPSWPSV